MAETRQRLQSILAFLQRHPDGVTTSEIAEAFGVTRQTALYDIKRIENDGAPIYQEGNRYLLDQNYQRQVHLSLAQAWLLYLPLRRMMRADLHGLPLISGLLHRIATLFDGEIADQLVPTVAETDNARNDVLLTLVEGWQRHQCVEVMYQRLNAERPRRLTIAPWWFEPAVWSDAFYVVGGLRRNDDSYSPITLKLDRIQTARTLPALTFVRPSGHEITAYLEQTWGIWVGDGAGETVMLRFHNRVFARLKETRWHPSQSMQVESDGSILWQAVISEPQEMLPWIRGWGADVEVITPDWLRQQIAAEAEATARLYGRNSAQHADFF